MTGAVAKYIREYIEQQCVLALATAADGESWVAPLFYVCDAALNLYFTSDPNTRHAQVVASNPRVAVAIYGQTASWREIRGVQMEGWVEVVGTEQRTQVEQLYLRRFPEIDLLLRRPADDQERKIAVRLGTASYYRITPLRIRFIDNRRGFGHREEIVLQEP